MTIKCCYNDVVRVSISLDNEVSLSIDEFFGEKSYVYLTPAQARKLSAALLKEAERAGK